jgi:hypothetical protein
LKSLARPKRLRFNDDTRDPMQIQYFNACSRSGVQHQPQSEARDILSRDGAMALAKRLQDYWHTQGYPAAEPIKERFAKVGTYEIYRVVCNLVNGLPPRYRDEAPERK